MRLQMQHAPVYQGAAFKNLFSPDVLLPSLDSASATGSSTPRKTVLKFLHIVLASSQIQYGMSAPGSHAAKGDGKAPEEL